MPKRRYEISGGDDAYICLEDDTEPRGASFVNFRAYLEDFVLYQSRSGPDKAQRRKAKRLIKEFAGGPKGT